MTNFIRGFESVGDSSACPQSGKDEFSNKVRVYTFVDRSAQSACRLCAMPFSANCECSLRSGIPPFLVVLSAPAGSSGVTDERSRRSHGISDFFIFISLPLPSPVSLLLDNRTGTCARGLPSYSKKEVDVALFAANFLNCCESDEIYFVSRIYSKRDV